MKMRKEKERGGFRAEIARAFRGHDQYFQTI